jgi:multicomponent Na+:H+ antiporter subunit D
MSGAELIVIALVAPTATAALVALFYKRPNAREGATMLGAVILFAAALALASQVVGGERPALHLIDVLPSLSIAFALEPLGALFATVASGLWIVNSLYSIGYMRANREERQTVFYVCFALAIAATMGIAFSGNLFTMFLFYEALTLVTYPLVTHRGDAEAKAAGRLYLMMLLGASTLLLLPAIAWTGVAAGTLDFRAGGVLAGKLAPVAMGVLLALYVFGIAKAAVMPMHVWLPAAMVAPTPVSALLHAVAVVKAGVFFIVKIVVFVFGVDTLRDSGAGEWLVWVAAFTVLAASLVALRQDNLKRRLAYSTISQLGYIVLGVALATGWGIVGAGLQIAMHAMAKITLFFCAGAIHTAAHKDHVSELGGLGRAMPLTYTFFLIGACSVIGLPLFGGFWAKWYLVLGAVDAGHLGVVAVLMISSLLNVAYLLPIPFRAFFAAPAEGSEETGLKEAPWPLLVAMGVTSLMCIVLFFVPGPIVGFLERLLVQ